MFQNFSLTELVLKKALSNSPTYTTTKLHSERFFYAEKVVSKRTFASFIYSRGQKSLKIQNSAFNYALNGAIYVNSDCSQQLVIENQDEINILGSCFKFCGVSDRSGGGILINRISATVQISKCCFFSCWANSITVFGSRRDAGGGGFAVYCDNLISFRNTFINCSTTTIRAPSFYAGTQKNCFINSTLNAFAFASSSTGASFIYDLGYLYIIHLNSSSNYLNSLGPGGATGVFPVPQYSGFKFGVIDNCTGTSLFWIAGSPQQSIMDHFSFTRNNNKNSDLIYTDNGNLHVTHCYFAQNENVRYTISKEVTVSYLTSLDPIIVGGHTISADFGSTNLWTIIATDACKVFPTKEFTTMDFQMNNFSRRLSLIVIPFIYN